jgi:hypothetical protein
MGFLPGIFRDFGVSGCRVVAYGHSQLYLSTALMIGVVLSCVHVTKQEAGTSSFGLLKSGWVAFQPIKLAS